MGGPQQIKLELFSTRWLEQAARSLTSTDGNVALLSVGIRNEIIGVAMHRLSDLQGPPVAQLAGNRSGFDLSPLDSSLPPIFLRSKSILKHLTG